MVSLDTLTPALHVENQPDSPRVTLSEFAQAYYQYCAVFGGSATSWIRTPARNKAVGGALGGAHPFGVGADTIYYDTVAKDTAEARKLFALTAPSLPSAQKRANALGLEIIRESDHDHLQPRGWANP